MDQSEKCTYPILFQIDDIVRHSKGGLYLITGLPDVYVLEHDRSPAYAYQMMDGRICVRKQSEMEDGRFTYVAKAETIKKRHVQD